MARNPRQEVALRRRYTISKEETRLAFEQALTDIAANPSVPVTEKTLYEAAGRSRATLNRYPDIKERLAEIRASRITVSPDKNKDAPDQVVTNHRLRALQQASTTLAQRVAILSVVVQDLERRNSSLVRLLQQHKVAIPIELVVDNTEEK
ncbi:hypothetical protein QF20_004945 [Salmonella enterica subsp. enterica]|nr:hypothetical protein [Salmonella enterica subsp. enterica serovar Mikawasima]EBR8658865.1 hypothetical protein [Salmonella enterica subsp. enterica serovar Kottbus]EBS1713843.1 hypothetical protein [Salmonella enterica subsp. enterica serovar Vitkin]ECF2559936.1 hypothetical protein [Salmonella enterica subsp. enterica serovar Ahuza]EEC5248945.1 hypothetical protein [Salmonella enterica subsp. enterica]HCP9902502.1 hypothetical protein [Salmonella enterica]